MERSHRVSARRRGCGSLLALRLLLCAAAHPAAAQVSDVAAVQVRGLGFAVLEPGRASVISVRDVAGRAEFLLVGEGPVEVRFVLPDALTSPEGSRIALSYGPLDGAFVAGPSAEPILFDPRQPQRFVLPPQMGEAHLYLGGTARPALDLVAARYSAPIAVLVTRPQR